MRFLLAEKRQFLRFGEIYVRMTAQPLIQPRRAALLRSDHKQVRQSMDIAGSHVSDSNHSAD
jgi:hypothetical protein